MPQVPRENCLPPEAAEGAEAVWQGKGCPSRADTLHGRPRITVNTESQPSSPCSSDACLPHSVPLQVPPALYSLCLGVPSIACCWPWLCSASPSPSEVWGWDVLWGHGTGMKQLCHLAEASLGWRSLSCTAKQEKHTACSKQAKQNQETYREPLFQRVCVHNSGSRVGL